LIGDNSQCETKPRKISYDQASDFARENYLNYLEVNLETGYNVREALEMICNDLVHVALRKRKVK